MLPYSTSAAIRGTCFTPHCLRPSPCGSAPPGPPPASCSPPELSRRQSKVSPAALLPSRLRGVDTVEHPLEVGARECPLERTGDPPIALAEGEQPLAELVQRAEVVRGERLALHDREVQLDLVQPRGVDRQVDQA